MKKTQKFDDRLMKIMFDAMDYVDECEKTALLELYKNITAQGSRALADRVERGMYTKGIITAVDCEKYGNRINDAVLMAIASMMLELPDKI